MGLDWMVDPKAPSRFDPPTIELWPEGEGATFRPDEAIGIGVHPQFCTGERGVIAVWRARKAMGNRYWAILLNGRLVKAVHLPDCCECQRCHPEDHGPTKCLCHWPQPRVHAPGKCFCSWHQLGGYP